jgi:uncharacterized coiled-coil DUF342 family protein
MAFRCRTLDFKRALQAPEIFNDPGINWSDAEKGGLLMMEHLSSLISSNESNLMKQSINEYKGLKDELMTMKQEAKNLIEQMQEPAYTLNTDPYDKATKQFHGLTAKLDSYKKKIQELKINSSTLTGAEATVIHNAVRFLFMKCLKLLVKLKRASQKYLSCKLSIKLYA